MQKIDYENAVVKMGDVSTVIDMIEQYLTDGNIQQADRAAVILREIFESRYNALLELCC